MDNIPNNNINFQQSRFPAGNHADYLPAGNQYQFPDPAFPWNNYGPPQNALGPRGSGADGWVGGQPMGNAPPAGFSDVNCGNPWQWPQQQPFISNSGNLRQWPQLQPIINDSDNPLQWPQQQPINSNSGNPRQWPQQQPINSNSGNPRQWPQAGNGMQPSYLIGVPEPQSLAVAPEAALMTTRAVGSESALIPTTMTVPVPETLPAEAEASMRIMTEAFKPRRWSREEHMLFLIGLKQYKKGDWKSISRHLVNTRSPTQVASHAQKYNKRRVAAKGEATTSDASTRKKRSSIHDTTVEDVGDVDDDEIKSLQDIINAQLSKTTST